MSLVEVKLAEEVWLTCITHSLSTETEEIMGLLFGDIEYSASGGATALIWGASPQSRSDRRKDRVETTPEQLTAATAQAERMTLATGKTTRVIGWYHSHPHITVFPSHVDMHTQAMYQLLDSGFVGLIFSCFSEDMNKIGRIQVIAFQSIDGKNTNASPSFSMLQNESKSRELGELFGSEFMSPSPEEDSKNMQEAMHRSTLDISSAEHMRKEIPLTILPASALLNFESPLGSYIDLQRVIYEEERSAYNQATSSNERSGQVHPLTFIHNTATYNASICKLVEFCLSPVLNSLQDRLKENELRIMMLKGESEWLEAEIQSQSKSNCTPQSVRSRAKKTP